MEHPMLQAREFFKSLGIRINEQGLVESNLTEEELTILNRWFENTEENGIQMPHEEDFYRNILLCISLAPQKEDGQIQYLLGKGIGVEIALRGDVKGREKIENNFPYRSHSDFEIYASRNGLIGGNFKNIFGAQEFYPEDHTKGLSNMPKGLMHDTAEKVEIDGYTFYVPQLELLFLDKFLVKESTPREQGCDARLLAMSYKLDSKLIHKYLEEYRVKPSRIKIEDRHSTSLSNTKASILRRINNDYKEMKECVGEDLEITEVLDELLNNLNKKMLDKRISCDTIFRGILKGVYEKITSKDICIDSDGKIALTEEYIKSLGINSDKYFQSEIKGLINKHDEVNNMLGIKKVFEKEEIESIHAPAKDELRCQKAIIEEMERDMQREKTGIDR